MQLSDGTAQLCASSRHVLRWIDWHQQLLATAAQHDTTQCCLLQWWCACAQATPFVHKRLIGGGLLPLLPSVLVGRSRQYTARQAGSSSSVTARMSSCSVHLLLPPTVCGISVCPSCACGDCFMCHRWTVAVAKAWLHPQQPIPSRYMLHPSFPCRASVLHAMITRYCPAGWYLASLAALA